MDWIYYRSFVANRLYLISIARKFSEHNEQISVTTLKIVLSSLTRVVKDVAKKEFINTQGAIMDGSRTYIGTHYSGVFTIYMRLVHILRNGKTEQHEELAVPLLSVSPIASIHYERERTGRRRLHSLVRNHMSAKWKMCSSFLGSIFITGQFAKFATAVISISALSGSWIILM